LNLKRDEPPATSGFLIPSTTPQIVPIDAPIMQEDKKGIKKNKINE